MYEPVRTYPYCMRAYAHFSPLWTRKRNNNTAYTYVGDVCTRLASSWTNTLFIAMAMKMNERGMEMEIQTNSTETWVGINFCGGVHGNAFVCIALTGPQRSKTIKLRETLSVFAFFDQKRSKKHDKTMHTYLHGVCVLVAVGGESAPIGMSVHI